MEQAAARAPKTALKVHACVPACLSCMPACLLMLACVPELHACMPARAQNCACTCAPKVVHACACVFRATTRLSLILSLTFESSRVQIVIDGVCKV